MTTRHGELYLRDQIPPRSIYYEHGRFGRLFPSIQPFAEDTEKVRDNLCELGEPGGLMDAGAVNNDNPTMPAGFTFLGQFMDHDMTFDPTSSLERQNDPEAISNFRTPLLELDNLYGAGRAANPHLYDRTTASTKFLVESLDPNDPNARPDLPRNSQNIAIIGDPRNDENVILSQLHLAFLKFHNAMVDSLPGGGAKLTDPNKTFREAQQLTRWHYQWIIVHEYLPTICGQAVVDDILDNGRKFYDWRNEPFIPVEFSVAAFRFGHSQVRPGYRVNLTGDGGNPFAVPIFDANPINENAPDPNDLRGGKRAPRRFVDWKLFFKGLGPAEDVAHNKEIDTRLSSALFELPVGNPGLPPAQQAKGCDKNQPKSLAQRNLLRSLTFGLPSGQNVAKAMSKVVKSEPLAPDEMKELKPLGFDTQTPLWYYILKEAEERAGGNKLGPVGARIVAEVMIGLLQGDHMSYLAQNPTWEPTLKPGQDFRMADLLKFAKVTI